MEAVAELPQLRDLAVTEYICGVHINQLDGAKELTRLEFVYGCHGEGRAWALLRLGLGTACSSALCCKLPPAQALHPLLSV